jgi:serine/threonine protein kinase
MLTGPGGAASSSRHDGVGFGARADVQGTVIDGKYEVLRQLGQGGMGAVYEARHRATGRKVAVKVIAPTALAVGIGVITRFQREARASGSIDSPFVVQVYDAGVDPTTRAPYMAMECLAGEDLQHVLARVGPLAPDVVLRICAHACHGLQKAHEAGIVHRDIKAANLFLSQRPGDANEVITKVLDFGIAKVRANPVMSGEDYQLTTTGSMLGSPVYMSPEQAIGAKDLDARSDIFSMGVMMYEALAGATPNGHLQNLGALIMAICSQDAPPLRQRAPWVPAEVAAIVHKALAISPSNRYQSAAELRCAVAALLPDGTMLRSEMLVALTAEQRDHSVDFERESPGSIAFVPTVLSPLATSASPPPSPARELAAAAAEQPSRPTGRDQVRNDSSKRVRWRMLAGAIAALTLGAAGSYDLLRPRIVHAPEQATVLASSSSSVNASSVNAASGNVANTAGSTSEGARVDNGLVALADPAPNLLGEVVAPVVPTPRAPSLPPVSTALASPALTSPAFAPSRVSPVAAATASLVESPPASAPDIAAPVAAMDMPRGVRKAVPIDKGDPWGTK